jgi:hypothetical protein
MKDRLYDQEHESLEAVGYDLILAGADLLGRDLARITGPVSVLMVRSYYRALTTVLAQSGRRFREHLESFAYFEVASFPSKSSRSRLITRCCRSFAGDDPEPVGLGQVVASQ